MERLTTQRKSLNMLAEYTFDANNGDEISTQWQNQGTWFYEVGYSIISQNAAEDGETCHY